MLVNGKTYIEVDYLEDGSIGLIYFVQVNLRWLISYILAVY